MQINNVGAVASAPASAIPASKRIGAARGGGAAGGGSRPQYVSNNLNMISSPLITCLGQTAYWCVWPLLLGEEVDSVGEHEEVVEVGRVVDEVESDLVPRPRLKTWTLNWMLIETR